VLFGRTGTPESGAHGVTALLVPMDTPGLTTNRFDCHGQRAIGRGSIFFENVRVPVSHRLGDENKGFVQVMQGFDFSRALIGLQCWPWRAWRWTRPGPTSLSARPSASRSRLSGRDASAGRFDTAGRRRAPALPAGSCG
jgi:hypothetical protein